MSPGIHDELPDDRTIAVLIVGDEHMALTPRFIAWAMDVPLSAADALAGILESRGYLQEVVVHPAVRPRFRQFRIGDRLRLLAQVRGLDRDAVEALGSVCPPGYTAP